MSFTFKAYLGFHVRLEFLDLWSLEFCLIVRLLHGLICLIALSLTPVPSHFLVGGLEHECYFSSQLGMASCQLNPIDLYFSEG